jgi:hypothetical protein
MSERLTAAAIKATFADWRTVKGRKVLQLIFEVSLEQQGDVLSVLGAPMPDEARWCGIALLAEPVARSWGHCWDCGYEGPDLGSHKCTPSQEAPAERVGAGDIGPEPAPPAKTEGVRACLRAVLLCKDERFKRWLMGSPIRTKEDTAAGMRACLDIASRSEIATSPKALARFLDLEARYLAETGQRAERRG